VEEKMVRVRCTPITFFLKRKKKRRKMNMATITLKKERIVEDQLARALFMIINLNFK
jgi:hypothetical protein